MRASGGDELHVPLTSHGTRVLPLHQTSKLPAVRGGEVTRQAILPIRDSLPLGMCGASALGPPEASAS